MFLKNFHFYQSLFPYLSVKNAEAYIKNTKRMKQRADGLTSTRNYSVIYKIEFHNKIFDSRKAVLTLL